MTCFQLEEYRKRKVKRSNSDATIGPLHRSTVVWGWINKLNVDFLLLFVSNRNVLSEAFQFTYQLNKIKFKGEKFKFREK